MAASGSPGIAGAIGSTSTTSRWASSTRSAYDFQKPYHVCGGLQDNYSWCGPSSTTQAAGIGNDDWITVQGGDGFYNRIDPEDPNIIYAESQDGNLSRRDLRTSEIEVHPPAGG